MKKVVLSLALSVVFACCACIPAGAVEGASSDWQLADGPYQQAGSDEAVSGRLVLSGGQTKTVADVLSEVQPLVGSDMEQAVYRDGEQLADTDMVASGDTIAVSSDSEPLGIVIRGDATSTGSPGLRQVIQVAKAVRGQVALQGAQAEAADVNGSGSLDLGDVVLAARYMALPQDADEDEGDSDGIGRAASTTKKTTTAQKTTSAKKTTTASKTASANTTTAKFGRTVLEGTNKLRSDNNVKPTLKESAKLDEVAQVRADEMAAAGELSHTRPDGSKFATACTLGKGLVLGENIHCNKGYALDETAKVAMEGWENSAPHRKQILEPRYSHIGLGFAQAKDGTWYCVQVFSNGDDVVSVDTPKAK